MYWIRDHIQFRLFTLSVLTFACIYFRESKKIVFREYLFSRMRDFEIFCVYKFSRMVENSKKIVGKK